MTGRALRVKICGLVREEDARVAVEAGADFLGAILSPGFQRSVQPARAATFSGESGVPLVAVVVDAGVAGAADVARAAGASILQLHGDEAPGDLASLRQEGDWRLWKAVRVRSGDDVSRAVDAFGPHADGLLLDGWHRGKGGGTGIGFPWSVVAPLRHLLPEGLTFVAAGGLDPDNVADAVELLAPHVVDVSSGVEVSPGEKDPGRVRAFIRNARDRQGSENDRGGDAPSLDSPDP
jgi:phosphoribosylanthranilate isomerase